MTNKLTCVISAFPDSYSEYGKISVCLIESLIAARGKEWDIKVISNGVEDNSMGYLDDHSWLLPYVIDEMTFAPDIWIQFSTPPLFARYGKLINIGFDVNHISDKISKRFLDGMNRMDLMLVLSDVYYETIKNTVIEHKTESGEVLAIDKLQVPVEIWTPGNNTLAEKIMSSMNLKQVYEDFAFVTNCVWGSGFDVNNIAQLVYSFWKVFENVTKKPALILKTNLKASSMIDIERIKKRIATIKSDFVNPNKLANIYLINGNLSDEQTVSLYNNPKVKVMMTISSHEIVGANLREFAITGKPIIAPDWGAFKMATCPIPTRMVDIDKSMLSEVIVPSQYSYPNVGVFEASMQMLYKNYPNTKLKRNTELSKIQTESISNILSKYIRNTSKSIYIPEKEEFEL